MKVTVYLNRIKTDIKPDFKRAEEYFKKRGLNFTFNFVDSDYKNLSGLEVQMAVGRRVLLQPHMANVVPIDSSDAFTMFVFNQEEFPVKSMPQGLCYETAKGVFVDIGVHRNNPTDLTYIEILHEIMHALVRVGRKAGFPITDVMDSYFNNFIGSEVENSNFGQQWKLLKPFLDSLKTKTKKLKHFSDQEVKGLQRDFAERCDVGREESGIPWVFTSTLRTPAHNKKVGGSPTSAHLDGTGADVRARNWVEVGKIVDGARKAGITGITVYRNSNHVHLDMKGYRLEVK